MDKFKEFSEFLEFDIRAGQVLSAEVLEGARKPAYKIDVDFGPEIGIKRSSAQITNLYQPEELVGRQVLGVVNFPPRLIAGFKSEVLILGVYTHDGVVLVQPDRQVAPGVRLG